MAPRRLLLVRHAQAGNAPLDRDRPLTEEGARHAAEIGAWLARAGVAPDCVVVSPALRAAQTWQQAAAALASAPEPVADQRIYDNTVDDLVAVIRELPDDVQCLIIVGHNPSVGGLADEIQDGHGSESAKQQLDRGFPAGGVAVFGLAGAWADIAPETATLREFWAARG
jgi:phosphohistidine phosphatase